MPQVQRPTESNLFIIRMNRFLPTVLFLLLLVPIAQAQEQFLKLDSIVLIKSDLNFIENNNYFSGVDSVAFGITSNQYLKVRSVTVVAKANGYPGSTTNSSSSTMINSPYPINIYDFSVSVADMTVFSKEDFSNLTLSGRLAKGRVYPDIIIPGQQLTGQQYLVSRTYFYDYQNNHNHSYEIICEVVYYSKE